MDWQIDPAHTSVSVTARHLMLTNVRASFAGVTGSLSLHPDRPEDARISLAIPAASVDTGEDKRDAHLRSPDFLDAERHPAITFTSNTVRRAGDDRFTVQGDLTIRGETRPVEVEVELLGVADGGAEKVVGFAATATIDRTQWGLVWNMPIPGGLLVSEKLKVAFDLQAKSAPAGVAAA